MERPTGAAVPGDVQPEEPGAPAEAPTESAQPPADQPADPAQPSAADAPANDRPIVSWVPPAPEPSPGEPGWRGIGSVVGRTFDTYGSSLGLFIALSIPTAILGGMSEFAGTNVPALILIAIATASASLVTGAATMIATDDLWRGVRPGIADVLDRAIGRLGALVGSGLVIVLVIGGLVIVLLIVGAVVGVGAALQTSTGAGIAVLGLLAIGLTIVGTVLALRWSLAGAAIVLDKNGPLAGLNRSRALTRGHVWRLAGLFVALGLTVALASGGASLLSTYASERARAAIGLAIATLLSGPVVSIVPAIVYRDLSGRPADAGEALPRRAGRRLSLIAVVGGGLILSAAGIWSVASAGGLIFVPDRGLVIAGTTTNAADPCRPGGVKTTFMSTEEIWIAAIFASHVPAGEEVVVEYHLDADLLGSAPLTAGPDGLDCYYEIKPIVHGQPGTYRIVVRYGSAVIADGGFTIR